MFDRALFRRPLPLPLTRLTLALAVLTTAAAAWILFAAALGPLAEGVWGTLALSLFLVLALWSSFGFWSALFGLSRLVRLPPAPPLQGSGPPPPGGGRCAILMPIYNEDTQRVFAAIAAMRDALAASPWRGRFTLFVLSDSTDPDRWLAEVEAARAEQRRPSAGPMVHYRRRARNVRRKVGNIEDFIARHGAAYETMLVLDADSLMSAETMVDLVRRMDGDPQLALIQVPPRLVRGESLFARLIQFSGELYGGMAASAVAAWAGDSGNYWGHNAIIRVSAFAQCCGLPALPGMAPFGGDILSHDFVEAALLRRRGWKIHMADDLEGSYEELPPSLWDFARRDRRWCQGNLQHALVLCARGLRMTSRLHLLIGILSYVAAPLWLAFLVATTIALGDGADGSWPVPVSAGWLFVGAMALLLIPRLAAVALALADGPRRRRLGGGLRLALGFGLELVLSALIAPILMLFHTAHVAAILTGGRVGWTTQRRVAGADGFDLQLTRYGSICLVAAIGGVAAWELTPVAFPWAFLVLAGPLASPVLAMALDSARLGLWLRRRGLLLTREEAAPPNILLALEDGLAQAPAAPATGPLARALTDPAASRRIFRVTSGVEAPTGAAAGAEDAEAQAIFDKLQLLGPEALSRAERLCVLADPQSFERAHRRYWIARLSRRMGRRGRPPVSELDRPAA